MKKLLLITCLFLFQVTNAQNNAFTFNGIDQQIATYTGQTNVRFTTQNFTIEAWVKPAAFVNSTGSFEHTIIGTDSSNTTGYVLRTGGSRKLDFTSLMIVAPGLFFKTFREKSTIISSPKMIFPFSSASPMRSESPSKAIPKSAFSFFRRATISFRFSGTVGSGW